MTTDLIIILSMKQKNNVKKSKRALKKNMYLVPNTDKRMWKLKICGEKRDGRNNDICLVIIIIRERQNTLLHILPMSPIL